ncbi:hypothetical protein RB195_020066 [Necator americanus]|uniref:MATH domain-containing protein n=1 Tax=Necator americanus TaxID=51031 RepID=A0ABR1CH35_NECAM
MKDTVPGVSQLFGCAKFPISEDWNSDFGVEIFIVHAYVRFLHNGPPPDNGVEVLGVEWRCTVELRPSENNIHEERSSLVDAKIVIDTTHAEIDHLHTDGGCLRDDSVLLYHSFVVSLITVFFVQKYDSSTQSERISDSGDKEVLYDDCVLDDSFSKPDWHIEENPNLDQEEGERADGDEGISANND